MLQLFTIILSYFNYVVFVPYRHIEVLKFDHLIEMNYLPIVIRAVSGVPVVPHFTLAGDLEGGVLNQCDLASSTSG